MRRVFLGAALGLCVGLGLTAPHTEAVRLPKPPTLIDVSPASLTRLNNYLEALWQLTNGRMTFDVTTTNPNGSRSGTNGDALFYSAAGSYKFCVNTTATTPVTTTGTTWRCNANTFTAP